MRKRLEGFAWRMWRDEAGWPGRVVRLLLLPFEGVWRLATRARNRRYDRGGGTRVEGLTVVSVGNLAVGGTGKTPVSAWVARAFRSWGASPSLLLRGYGEDEIELHRRWNPDMPIVAAAKRVEGARQARDEGADSAVLDDGFQHRGLQRSLDLVLLAAEDPVPGPVLPRGPFREPVSALRRADVVVVTRRGGDAEGSRAMVRRLEAAGVLSDSATTAALHLAPHGTVTLEAFAAGEGPHDEGEEGDEGGGASAPTRGEEGLVVTAIARPEAFLRDVETLVGVPCELLSFPDHHRYDASDARRIRARAAGRPVYVTEKDAVKLAGHRQDLPPVRVVGQRIVWDWGEEEVRRRLESVVRPGEELS